MSAAVMTKPSLTDHPAEGLTDIESVSAMGVASSSLVSASLNAMWAEYEATVLPTLDPWFQELKRNAWEQFKAVGLPSYQQEAWRFVQLKPFLNSTLSKLSAAQQGTQRTASPVLASPILSQSAARIVLTNDTWNAVASHMEGLPVGVACLSLAQVMQGPPPEWLKRAKAFSDTREKDGLFWLNRAFFTDGLLLYVPSKTNVSAPIEISFEAQTDTPSIGFPHAVVVVEPESTVDVLIHYNSQSASALTIQNGVHTVWVGGEQSATEHVTTEYKNLLEETQSRHLSGNTSVTLVHEGGKHGMHFVNHGMQVHAGARATNNSVVLTGKLVRNAVEAHLAGETADVTLNGLSVLKGQTQAHHRTKVAHQSANATSEQVYRGIVDDQSRCEFDGVIVVPEGSQKTQAHQLTQNLLLSDEAQVFARPWLQIDADDVKCSHGATVGQLSAEELFYLESRGIGQEEAQSLLTLAFAQTVLENIEHPVLREALRAKVALQLQQ